jgi:hypothetical protein
MSYLSAACMRFISSGACGGSLRVRRACITQNITMINSTTAATAQVTCARILHLLILAFTPN